MPMYEFVCRDCGMIFDAIVKEKDDSVLCRECGEQAQRSQINQIARPQSKTNMPLEDLPTVSADELDRRVGADADKRWEKIERDRQKRQELKKELGAEYLSGPPGKETVMSEEELTLRKRVKEIMTKEPKEELKKSGVNVVTGDRSNS